MRASQVLERMCSVSYLSTLSESLDLVIIIIISQADYLSHFHMVVFVYCRDLRGRSIQDYVADTYPPFLQVRIKSEILW